MYSQRDIKELTNCVVCGSDSLVQVIDLGYQPPANSYKSFKEDRQEFYPLATNKCSNCHHVQLSHSVNPEILFRDYLYVSGTSTAMKKHFEWFAGYTIEYFENTSYSPHSVLDVGCNDGSQLDIFKGLGLRTTGVDPAINLYKLSSKNHQVFPMFFDSKYLEEDKDGIVGGYDIIIAQNVFAHTDSPRQFLETAKKVMHNSSLMFIQTSQADMILNNEFDTIYHEHISFFNINSMNELCKSADLNLVDVVKCPLHGNSYIFVISKSISRPFNVENLISMESKLGLYDDKIYNSYAIKCKSTAESLKSVIDEYNRIEVGFNIVGYGAAAKGMTVLNYTGIKLDFIIDDNPLKQNKFTPGSNIPIVSSERLKTMGSPILFVPLAWNFFDEICEKIKTIRDNPYDRFLRYFPSVEVVE